jgi:hypothetical protein
MNFQSQADFVIVSWPIMLMRQADEGLIVCLARARAVRSRTRLGLDPT